MAFVATDHGNQSTMAYPNLSVRLVGGGLCRGPSSGQISSVHKKSSYQTGQKDLQHNRYDKSCGAEQQLSNSPRRQASKSTVRRRHLWLFQAFLFLFCLLLYWNALECGFVFDDMTAIRDNKDLRPHVPLKNLLKNDFWGTSMTKEQSHKSYRPFTVLTFRWNYAVGGLDPSGYHLVNVLLHGIVSVMYFRFCRKIATTVQSFVASILFSSHPIHTEAVTGVVGRAELLASIFFLASIMSYTRCVRRSCVKKSTRFLWLLFAISFATLAMLSKEQGITVIGVCIVFEVVVVQKLKLADVITFRFLHFPNVSVWLWASFCRIFALLSATLVLILVRLRVMGHTLPVFTKFDNPAATAPIPVKQLTFSYLASLNGWLLLNPCDLICDWTMNTVPLVHSFFDLRNLSTLTMFFVIGAVARAALKSTSRTFSSGLVVALTMTLIPFLPASNLFFPVGFVIAERVLYLPSMGVCLLISIGTTCLGKRFSRKLVWFCGIAFLTILFAAKTVTRNQDWTDEVALFRSGLKVTRSNAKLFNNVGHAFESKKEYGEALRYFEVAVRIQPDDIGAHINLGRTYNHLKLYKEAEDAYLRAKSLLPTPRPGETYQARVAPNHLNVFVNLATLISRNGTRLEEADLLYRQAISMRSDYTQAYINRGDILMKMNRTIEAQEVYETALTFEQENPDLLSNLAVVLLNRGHYRKAMALLNKALEFDPDHFQALLNSAILIQETGSVELRQLAVERLMRIVDQGKTNERVLFNLGLISMDNKDTISAEKWFRKAIDMKPDFRSALFNLALLLAETGRPLESTPILKTLLAIHPDHIKALILLGDIYVNHLRDLPSAEKCYRRILRVDPDNVQALHNLCVVMVEAGDLPLARDCLQEAHTIAPNEEYILKHLRIVEEKLLLEFPPSK